MAILRKIFQHPLVVRHTPTQCDSLAASIAPSEKLAASILLFFENLFLSFLTTTRHLSTARLSIETLFLLVSIEVIAISIHQDF